MGLSGAERLASNLGKKWFNFNRMEMTAKEVVGNVSS